MLSLAITILNDIPATAYQVPFHPEKTNMVHLNQMSLISHNTGLNNMCIVVSL